MNSTTLINPLGFLVRRHKVGYWLILGFLAVYVVLCAYLFLQWVNPSLVGHSDLRIAADSGTYMYMAQVLREGTPAPWVYAALAPFPNTLWMPVFLAYIIPSTIGIALLNLVVFLLSVDLFRRATHINVGVFIGLLLLNPTTTVSILSINKEIFDLFVAALFCCALRKDRKWLFFLAFAIAFFNRFEVCVALIVILIAQSRWNPLRNRRRATLIALALLLTVALPALAGHSLARRFVNAENGNVVRILDLLEMHYLFALAVIPKIIENMFGALLNVGSWRNLSTSDLANSYILILNNFASLVVVVYLALKRELRIRNDWVYFACIGALLMATALVNQPRYFYYCFVFLCLQAAQIPDEPRHSTLWLMFGNRDTQHA